MLGASLHARSPVFWRPLTGAPALPSITRLVIEGDSITSTSPSAPNGAYSYQYGASRPDKTIDVRAQASRVVGLAANLDDDGNSLMGNVAEDMAFGPQLLTAMIGANDLAAARTAAQYKGDLIAYNTALKAAGAGCKFAWSPPLPYNPTGTPHPSYANFTAQRAAVMADARDPAVWGRWADYYLPLGEHPDFADPGTAAPLFGDGVHPSTAGQALLFQVYKAAVDSILDASRAGSTRMHDAAWPAGETDLAPSARIVRRFIVSGLKHTGLALVGSNALAVSGDGSPLLRRAGGAWAASVTGWLYNGDVIDVTLTTSASATTATAITLQIGSETRELAFTTVAGVTPASVIDGGYAATTNNESGSFLAKPFETGVAVVAVDTNGAFSTGVSVGGTPLALRRRDGYLELWTGEVAAGSHDIVVTKGSGYQPRLGILWLTVKDADPTPVAAGTSSAADVPPHATPALTRPASGVMLGFINYLGTATPPTVSIHAGDAESELIRQGGIAFNSEASTLAVAKRAASGAIAFDNGGAYASVWRTGIVFKAAGT